MRLAEPFWQWWVGLVLDPEPPMTPAQREAYDAMQAMGRALHRRFQERDVNMKFEKVGIRVSLGGRHDERPR